MKKKYFSFVTVGDVATINIYGDITSWAWEDLGEVSAHTLSKQLDELPANVKELHVYINSYGGEVAEGLAIYNALKRKKQTAKVVTYCDGFACSIASVIFMAGEQRIMHNASLLMVHNAWTFGQGNAAELRKLADDMDIITSASIAAYKENVTISEKKIKELMDNETWIAPKDAVKYGFATEIQEENTEKMSQNARETLFNIVMAAKNGEETDLEEEEDNSSGEDENEDKDGENDGNNTENDVEEPEKEEDEEKEPDEEQEEQENPTEKLGGFFNAIFKI